MQNQQKKVELIPLEQISPNPYNLSECPKCEEER